MSHFYLQPEHDQGRDEAVEIEERIVIRIANTRSGRLLARAIRIMEEKGCSMGEAMDYARHEAACDGESA